MPADTPPSVDARLARLAARQHGVVTIGQLRELGLGSPGVVANRVARGRLHRIHRGVYTVGHRRLSQEGLWMAAVLGGGERTVLSHLSAAVLWKAWRRRVTTIDVQARSLREIRGVRVHRSRTLDPRDTTTRNGIPTTTMARTLVDLTDVLTAHQLANVIHEAAFRGHFNEPATRAALKRANGRHHRDRLVSALQLNAAGSAGTKSGHEDRFLALVRQAGLPEPQVNTHVENLEVDFFWPTLKLAVEVDGEGHTRARTRREDELRDRVLTAAGLRVVRLTGGDVERLDEAAVRDLAPRGLALLEPFDPELALHARRALELDVLVRDHLEVVAPGVDEVESARSQDVEPFTRHGGANGLDVVDHQAEVA
jgi:very-short-patch-repair endonuclease